MPDFDGTARWLLEGAEDTVTGLEQAGDEHARRVAARLRDSVVRPLHGSWRRDQP